MRFKIDGKPYDFDEETLTNKELMRVERETGLTTVALLDGANRLSMIALTAVVWMIRLRTEPALQFDDVEFAVGSLELLDDGDTDPGNGGGGTPESVGSPTTLTPTSSPSPTGGGGPGTLSKGSATATT